MIITVIITSNCQISIFPQNLFSRSAKRLKVESIYPKGINIYFNVNDVPINIEIFYLPLSVYDIREITNGKWSSTCILIVGIERGGGNILKCVKKNM